MANAETTTNESRAARRRKREREQRRQSILDAAETLFAGNGYHSTGIEQIADLAEISVGTVYFYFKNKEDLLTNLLDDISIQLREVVGREFRSTEATLEVFERTGKAFLEGFCQRHPAKVFILLRESVGQGAAVEERRRKLFQDLIGDIVHALTRVAGNLGLTPENPGATEVVAVSIVGMSERLAYQYLIWGEGSQDLSAIAGDAMRFVLGGVGSLVRREEQRTAGGS